MNESRPVRIEYVEARRVLLDALVALQPHIGAIVLVGAQAVYLRTAGRLPTYQPFTTDSDLVVDPNLRARRRLREQLRAEVEKTFLDPAETDDELRHLFAALAV